MGAPDARAPLDRRPSDRPPRLDRPLRPPLRHGRRRLPRPRREGARGAHDVRGRGRRGGSQAPVRRAAGPVAHRARRAGPGAAGVRAGHPLPLVRPAHVRCLHGHRPAHGDLGPRPGRRRHPGCGASPHRPAQACGPHRGPHPGLRLRRARARRARRGVPGGDPRPLRRHLDLRSRGRPQRVTGTALDFCLLVTQRAHRADVDVRAEGPDAGRWLDIAQAFAGPPGDGRPPKGDAE